MTPAPRPGVPNVGVPQNPITGEYDPAFVNPEMTLFTILDTIAQLQDIPNGAGYTEAADGSLPAVNPDLWAAAMEATGGGNLGGTVIDPVTGEPYVGSSQPYPGLAQPYHMSWEELNSRASWGPGGQNRFGGGGGSSPGLPGGGGGIGSSGGPLGGIFELLASILQIPVQLLQMVFGGLLGGGSGGGGQSSNPLRSARSVGNAVSGGGRSPSSGNSGGSCPGGVCSVR
jgi:hypothetical protein